MKYIPNEAIERLGCSFCEWRHTRDCPLLNLEKHTTDFPVGIICEKRKAWIFSLSREYQEQPSFSTWQLDFNKAIAQIRMLKEMWLEEYLTNELEAKEKAGTTPEDLIPLKRKIKDAKDTWTGFWKEINRLEDLQVNRETPKFFKTEVKHVREMNLEDFGRLINNSKIVDVPEERKKIGTEVEENGI